MNTVIQSISADPARYQNLLLTVNAMQAAFTKSIMQTGAPNDALTEVYTEGQDTLVALIEALGIRE